MYFVLLSDWAFSCQCCDAEYCRPRCSICAERPERIIVVVVIVVSPANDLWPACAMRAAADKCPCLFLQAMVMFCECCHFEEDLATCFSLLCRDCSHLVRKCIAAGCHEVGSDFGSARPGVEGRPVVDLFSLQQKISKSQPKWKMGGMEEILGERGLFFATWSVQEILRFIWLHFSQGEKTSLLEISFAVSDNWE